MADEPVLSDEELKHVQLLAEARRNSAAWKKIEDDERKELLALAEANSSDIALTASGAPAFHLERSERTKVDTKKLEALYPETYADVATVTEVITVKTDLD